jgi:hypothetical protein
LAVVVVAVAAITVLWRFDLLGVRSISPVATVASAFDVPSTYPGYHWMRDGALASEFEVTTIAGPDHCGWGSATMMFIGWPPPTVASTADRARQFIRDPLGIFGDRLHAPLRRDLRLPADARATGYHYGSLEIFVSPSDADGIYVVSPRDAERWPASDPMILCA